MKKFLLSSLLFGLVVISLFVLVIAGVSYKIQNTPCHIDKSKNVLVLGHSHPETAINDSLIPNWINCAESGESSLVTFNKLKYYIKHNPQIDTVIFSFSLIAIGPQAGLFQKNYFTRYWYLYSWFDYSWLLTNKIEYSHINVYSIRKLLSNDEISPCRFGGYEYLRRDKLYEDIERRKNVNKKINYEYTQSFKIRIEYMKKMKELCDEKGVKLLFMQFPHYRYSEYSDSDYYYNIYEKYFSDIPLLDYVNYPLPDSCYADMTHLNYRGAKIFTEQLKKDFYGE